MKHKLLNFNFFYTLAAIFFSFYKTDLHQVIDDLFYDVAIMFKQETASTSRHIIIDLDQKPTNDTEVFDRLIQVANQLSEADPEKIVITLYPHVFKKDDPRILQLFQKHLDDNRFYYGLYGHHSSFPTQYRLNFPFALAAHQIWGMETFKKRSPSVLRMFDFQMYLGKTSVEHLVKKVSEVKLDRPVNLQKERLGLIHPKNFQVIGWNELDIHHQQNIFQKKVVWISTSEYRIRPIFADEDHVNTSWQKEGGPLENGFPFVYALAGATINLEQNKILNAISIYSQIFLTLFFSLYCFYVWYTPHSLTLSTILYFLGWITFVFCTSLSVSFLNYWIPIAPIFLCSSLITLLSCYYRSQREGIYQAKSEASLEAEKIKSISYSRFLDRFADEVNNLNQKLLKTVQFLPNLMQKPSESYLKIVRLLKQSAEEFSDYLKAMKQISAIEGTKKYRIHREEFLIKPLIEKSLAQFSSRIEEMKLSIVWNIPDQYKMISDEKLLEPIIFNLLSNAIKYSHKSGKIFITITLLNKKTLLSIKDEGPGVDPKFHQLIFEKFYRIKDETNIKIKGTGLGLYLCKFFIKKLGGEIFINPEVTEGAEFQILI